MTAGCMLLARSSLGAIPPALLLKMYISPGLTVKPAANAASFVTIPTGWSAAALLAANPLTWYRVE